MKHLSLIKTIVPFVFVWLLITLPHFQVMKYQRVSKSELSYTPMHLNNYFTRMDDLFYLFPIINVYRNHTIYGRLSSYDFKDSLDPVVLQNLLPVLVNAGIICITRSTESPFYALGIFVALAFIFIYKIVYHTTQDSIFSYAIAFVVIFAYHQFFLSNLERDWINAFSYKIHNDIDNNSLYELNSFYRLITFGGTYWYYLAFTYALIKILDGHIELKNTLMAAGLYGIMFYTYIFYTVATSGILFFLLLTSIVKKQIHVKPIAIIIVVGLIIGLPNVILIKMLLAGGHQDYLLRMGISKPAMFWDTLRLAILMIIMFLVMKKSSFKSIALSLGATIIIFENLSYTVGLHIQTGHLYHRGAYPHIVIAIFLLLYSIFHYNKYIYTYVFRPLVVCLAIFFTYEAYHYSEAYALNTYKDQGITQEQEKLFLWLKGNTTKDDVVGSLSIDISYILPLHVPIHVYTPFATTYPPKTSNGEIAERLALLLYLADANDEDIKAYLEPKGSYMESRYVNFYFWYSTGRADYKSVSLESLCMEVRNKLSLIRKTPILYLSKHRINYFIMANQLTKEKMFVSYNKSFMNEINNFGHYRIFQIKK
ncbi:MAG: hypothetical protein HQK96_03150 [Nitrospirae bacterium]|nr:hypothetical protein [Nitrospirota bacterium]